jgi:microcystin-dependent protein
MGYIHQERLNLLKKKGKTMADPYISQIILLPFKWAPVQYSQCDGTLLDPNQNAALYSLIGNIFGGSGTTSFALPDLRGRAALHEDETFQLGEKYGYETVALSSSAMPVHTHSVVATEEDANSLNAVDSVLAKAKNKDNTDYILYTAQQQSSPTNLITMNTDTCSAVGANTPHANMQPSIVMNFCIAVEGTYPPRN